MRQYYLIGCIYCLLSFPIGANSDKAIACLDITDKDIRLICYDREISILKSTKNQHTTKETASTSNHRASQKITVAFPKRDEIPSSTSTRNKKEKRKDIANKQRSESDLLTITSAKKSIRGHWLITLNNGEIWVENEPSRRPLKVNQVVSIKRGPMNHRMLLESGRVIFVRAHN